MASRIVRALPLLLFLHEPCDGLSSPELCKLVHLLRALARGSGTLVVFTDRRPRDCAYGMLDRLMLLVDRRVAYDGPR